MTKEQASIAVPILNSYAHQYLGLQLGQVMVAAADFPQDGWRLMVALPSGVRTADDLDAAKQIIDNEAR